MEGKNNYDVDEEHLNIDAFEEYHFPDSPGHSKTKAMTLHLHLDRKGNLNRQYF